MKKLLLGISMIGTVGVLCGCTEKVVEVHHHYYESAGPEYTTPGNPEQVPDRGAADTYEAVSQ